MGVCSEPAVAAIRSHASRGKCLVTTIWQEEEDAPSTAARYCGLHTITVAAGLAALTDSRLHVASVDVDIEDD
jgi:hypothetical protein